MFFFLLFLFMEERLCFHSECISGRIAEIKEHYWLMIIKISNKVSQAIKKYASVRRLESERY